MAAVVVDLAGQSIRDIPTALIAVVAAVVLVFYRLITTWLIIGGAIVGLIVSLSS